MSQFLIGGRGSDVKPKCPIFLCPKVPKEGGCQARMGQCPLFLFFFYFEGIPYQGDKSSLTWWIFNKVMNFHQSDEFSLKRWILITCISIKVMNVHQSDEISLYWQFFIKVIYRFFICVGFLGSNPSLSQKTHSNVDNISYDVIQNV